jgi:hypothetical protein
MPKVDMKEAAADAKKDATAIHEDVKKLASASNKDMTQFEQLNGITNEAVKIYKEAKEGKNKYSVADAKKMFEKHDKNLSATRTKLGAHAKLAGNYKKTVDGLAVQIKNAVKAADDKKAAEKAFEDAQEAVDKALASLKLIISTTTSLPREPSID